MNEELMQSPLTSEYGAGVYRVRPLAWTVQEYDSGSVAIRIAYGIVQEWNAEQKLWQPEWPTGWFVYGSHFIVKKDGSVNASAVESLKKAGIWDGDFSVLEVDPPNDVIALATVEENVYDGKVDYRVAWVDPNADEPRSRGGFQPADPTLLASLRTRFQSQVRAIAGGSPKGVAPAPPAAAPPAPAAPAGGPGQEETPFG